MENGNIIELKNQIEKVSKVKDVRQWFENYLIKFSNIKFEDAVSIFRNEVGINLEKEEFSFSLFTENYEYFIMSYDPHSEDETDAFISCNASYRFREDEDEIGNDLFQDVLSEDNFIIMSNAIFRNEFNYQFEPAFSEKERVKNNLVKVIKENK